MEWVSRRWRSGRPRARSSRLASSLAAPSRCAGRSRGAELHPDGPTCDVRAVSPSLLSSPAIALLVLACGGASPPGESAAAHEPAAGNFQGDGARLYYRWMGSGPDVLVMIHGGPGMDSGYMAADFAPLAERHRLLFYDQRGGGRSEILGDVAGHYAIARHVADLEALRRHFGLERMTLVAHSFGPAIAAAYAIEHPDRVARMIFIG